MTDISQAQLQRIALEMKVAELMRALASISRMKLFPDDKINRTTLHAAIEVARWRMRREGR
jgi:hypothetical protein